MSRNITDQLFLDRARVACLLRACGTSENILRSGSDYDWFSALAEAMPLCVGHGYAAFLERMAQDSTGLHIPLCPHSAPRFWRTWSDHHWRGKKQFGSYEPISPCPYCTPVEPNRLSVAVVARLPDPLTLPASENLPDLSAFERRLSDALPARMGSALLTLPDRVDFVRPDPYHASLALQAVSAHAAGEGERAMLLAQSLRILGEKACERGSALFLVGGRTETVLGMLDYLQGVARLPTTVWFPDQPSDAARVCGRYIGVGTGYIRSATDSPADVARKRDAYARMSPIGRAVELAM